MDGTSHVRSDVDEVGQTSASQPEKSVQSKCPVVRLIDYIYFNVYPYRGFALVLAFIYMAAAAATRNLRPWKGSK